MSKKGQISWRKGKTNIYTKETLKLMSESHKGKYISEETKRKMSESHKGKYGYWNEKCHSEEYKQKMSESNKGRSPWNKGRDYPLSYYKYKYPLFYKIEKPRIRNGKIEVCCKFCKKWFYPNKTSLQARISSLEHDDGNDGCYLYCSDQCKHICPLYHLHSDPYRKVEKPYTEQEYQTFRTFVLERDNYICQFCGEKATDVHHEKPQKLEPFFSLDPDYAWSCCEQCHYKFGHKEECNTSNLASKICI